MGSETGDGPQLTTEPMERLTILCAEMTEVLDRPENGDVRGIVFLDDDERGGIVMHGWNDSMEGMAALFFHMQAIFAASGKDLQLIAVPDSPELLDQA